MALREAIVNALVHNDYSREIAPKFEIFDDRIEITSYGGLPFGFTQDEFFKGHSVPRNKEIMRIFRDLDMVEQLGSGIPRILEHYSRSVFEFTENFLRIVFPMDDEAFQRNTEQVTRLIQNILPDQLVTTTDMLELLNLRHKPTLLYDNLST